MTREHIINKNNAKCKKCIPTNQPNMPCDPNRLPSISKINLFSPKKAPRYNADIAPFELMRLKNKPNKNMAAIGGAMYACIPWIYANRPPSDKDF